MIHERLTSARWKRCDRPHASTYSHGAAPLLHRLALMAPGKEATMARILFLFGTTDGHTGRVAQHVAKALRELGHSVDLVDVGESTRVSFAAIDAAIVAGSVRMGRFQPKLVALVREHGDSLARLPNAFLAVSLAAAQHSASAREGIAKTLRRFSAE